jgi:isoleucyl-tRNA synthetase
MTEVKEIKKARYREYKKLDFQKFEEEILEFWKQKGIFKKSVESREGKPAFTFYEGPPSANGIPGIHHVMARTLKDIFCRYKTLQGFQVKRKAGWDTHGLPIELQVEKSLGITKEDIGKKISIAEYNEACRRDVMKFTDLWNTLTERIGFWVDMEDPYITYENKYIESCWHLLKKLYEKGYLYKGHTIQPYSPAAGTGLSSHELNQPGTYRMVKDTTVVAQFKIAEHEVAKFEAQTGIKTDTDLFFLAWTTTPWTLPSNTALAVGEKISYIAVKTFNPYTHQPITVVLAKELLNRYFSEKDADLNLSDYKPGEKALPFKIIGKTKGKDLVGIRYEQLLPYGKPEGGDAFRVIPGDFVTTEDGTGIVHIAPSFGSDDFRVAKQHGIGSLTLVDKQGRFLSEVSDFPLEYVKEAYLTDQLKESERVKQGRDKYLSVDERIAIKLKTENRAFKVERYEHSYPHCWRTDKPILYYPLESWFIKTTAVKDRLVELNKTINWKPESTGTGRFGNWLENLVDWNLSRSRYWGTPLPIWRTEDCSEEICIDKAVKAGLMEKNPLSPHPLPLSGREGSSGEKPNGDINFDLHRPYVDEIILVSASGKPMRREADLIDVWFDSGAMPYAQWHWPFENEETFRDNFPADFIAEGVDQTRGWFFTLHAIAVMLFDSVAYKNVVANGLVLDKAGNKMSKRLGNAVDPFSTIEKYGADAVRWYMLSNSVPWENLKFDIEGVAETQRKFFGTLYNVYSFFSLYANIDGFEGTEEEIPVAQRPEIDRWIISLLNSLILEVQVAMDDYDPTRATRAIETFVSDHLSNWYVRLCRRRFWKPLPAGASGKAAEDKTSAYQTLFACLDTVSKLMASFAPFYSDRIYRDLHAGKEDFESVHLAEYPKVNNAAIDRKLEEQMQLAQDLSSMVLSLRKKANIKVRQPLQRIMMPAGTDTFREQVETIKPLLLSEVNVKELEFITDDNNVIVKKVKPNFKALGPKVGPKMKQITAAVGNMSAEQISTLEEKGVLEIDLGEELFPLEIGDVEVLTDDIPGWQVAVDGKLTVALDTKVTPDLEYEGTARELVNRIQNLRKDQDYQVTDRINIFIEAGEQLREAIARYKPYICNEVLANTIEERINIADSSKIEVNDAEVNIKIEKV